MSDATRSFIALMHGATGLILYAGLDTFIFHRLPLEADFGIVLVYAAACGIHWAVAPAFPLRRGDG